MNKIALYFFLWGLSLGAGPCMASCGPLLISYAAGTQKNVFRSIWMYFIFSFGRILVYAALGVCVFFFEQLVARISESYSKYVFIFGGIFIGTIGILMLIDKNFKACHALRSFFLKKDTLTIFTFGLVIGMLPCLPLVSVLSYIGLISKSWYNGLFYSLAFGLGTIISPLLLISALSGLISRINLNNEYFAKAINIICGFIITILGMHLLLKGFGFTPGG